jgi:hypothetical protein
VITVSHTAVATVAAIEMAGATPVLVDIDPRTCTIDPREVREGDRPGTRAVIAVHLYGSRADLDALLALRREHGFQLVEDCAQSAGGMVCGKAPRLTRRRGLLQLLSHQEPRRDRRRRRRRHADAATAHEVDLLRPVRLGRALHQQDPRHELAPGRAAGGDPAREAAAPRSDNRKRERIRGRL